MSVNAAVDQSFLAEVAGLRAIIEELLPRWRNSVAEETQASVEAEVLDFFQRFLDGEYLDPTVMAGQSPELGENARMWQEYRMLLRQNLARLKLIVERYANYYNSQQVQLLSLTGRLKRIKQKRAALALWNDAEVKHAVSEQFLNWLSLATDYITEAELSVDTEQGILTLPIRSRKTLAVKRVRVGKDSNGQPGNSDVVVTTNNTRPEYILDGNQDTWFEYERLDQGDLRLALIFEFAQEQIVNHLTIEPINFVFSNGFIIEDVIFNGTSTTSIKDLIPLSDVDAMTVRPVGEDTAWHQTFVPITARTITMILRQPDSVPVQVLTADGREVQRDRWAIGIRSLQFERLQFESKGEINSGLLGLNRSVYAAAPSAWILPTTMRLFTAELTMSFDGGETFKTENGDGLWLLEGAEDSFIWKLRVERNDEAFKNVGNLLELSTKIWDVETMSRVASPEASPLDVLLPEKPANDSVYIYQPKILRRGDRDSRLKFSKGSGANKRLRMPFSLVKRNIDVDSVKIYVDGRKQSRAQDPQRRRAGQWAFNQNFKEMELPPNVSAGADIELVLDEELMHFEERSDGFYHKVTLPFDPDKQNIKISFLPRNSKRKTQVLNRNRKVIDLGSSFIESDKFNLSDNSTFTAVDTLSEAVAGSNNYYLDSVNGILHLSNPLSDEIVSATFTSKEPQTLSEDDFDVVFENGKPWGIRISPDVFVALEETETFSDSLKSVVNVVSGEYGARSVLIDINTNSKALSHQCLIKGSVVLDAAALGTTVRPEEVDFIDGHTEFLGLIPMNNEVTVETDTDDEFVEFTLSAGALWSQSTGVVFGDSTVFATNTGSRTAAQVGSVGDWYVGPTGLVTVNVGPGGTLAGGISLSYYYRDPDYVATNKYSVDYEDGIVYTGGTFVSGATYTYKTACYKIGYDVVAELPGTYSPATNTVKVRTDKLFETNDLIKLAWVKKTERENAEQFKDYFTPIIQQLDIRFY